MKKGSLEVELRSDLGKNKVKKIKEKGLVPGIVYGENKENIPVIFDPRFLQKLYRGLYGSNLIINLKIKNDKQTTEENVVAYDISRDALSQKIIHVDFLRLNMEKPLHTHVPLILKGNAPGTKLGGILIQKLSQLDIRCLPDLIPEMIEVDISNLGLDDAIKARDLELDERIEVLTNSDSTIVQVEIPKKAEEETPVAAAAEGEVAASAEGEKKAEAGAEKGDKKQEKQEKPGKK